LSRHACGAARGHRAYNRRCRSRGSARFFLLGEPFHGAPVTWTKGSSRSASATPSIWRLDVDRIFARHDRQRQRLRTLWASPVPTSHCTAPPFWRSGAGLLAISRLVDQCSDQSQQLLVLRAFALTEEHSDLDVGHMPTRWEVGLVSDEHPPRIGIAGEMPSITVRAVIKLSGKKGHACCSSASASRSAS
jgi:hypothetical protein